MIYQYSRSQDFTFGAVAPAQLLKDVQATLPTISHINTYGDVVELVFPEALPDKAVLDQIVAGHLGVEIRSRLETFLGFSLSEDQILDYDYVRMPRARLHQVATFTKGHITEVNFYDPALLQADLTLPVGAVPIITESFVYQDGQLGPVLRTQTITWWAEDGGITTAKSRLKVYSPTDSVQAGRTQRSNVVAGIEADLGIMLAAGSEPGPGLEAALDVGRQLIAALQDPINLFIQSSSGQLYQAVAALDPLTFPLLTAEVAPGVSTQAWLLAQLEPWKDNA